jgi:hypothetical protein
LNWDDSAARRALIERIGPAAYNAALEAHQKASAVNGYQIRLVSTRLGRLYQVGGTGMSFTTRDMAETYARSLPAKLQMFWDSLRI